MMTAPLPSLRSLLAAVAAVVALAAFAASAHAQVPPSRALFLDLDTVFQQSQVGTGIRGQLETMLAEVKTRSDAADKAFEQREATLLSTAQGRPEEELRRDWEQIQTERAAQAQVFQLERAAVQAAASSARRQVNGVLNEIMQEILVERGANMILDVKSVHVGGVDYDITSEVIARLDRRLPSLTVERPKQQ